MIDWWHRLLRWLWPPPPVLLLPEPEPVPEPVPEPEPPPPRPPPDPERAARRAELRKLAKSRRVIADRIDDVLTRFEKINMGQYQSEEIGSRQSVRMNSLWSNLMGCDFHFLGGLSDLTSDHQVAFFDLTAKEEQKSLADMVEQFWPFDHAVICHHDNDDLFLERLYTITAPEVRGRTKTVAPKMLRHVYGYLFRDGDWWLDDAFYGWIGGKWLMLPMTDQPATQHRSGILVGYFDMSAKRRAETFRNTAMMFSMKLTERYEWHVALGPDMNGPRILLPTSPIGCQVLFKDRDKLDKSRRAALRHWVMRHYRERGEQGLAFVRQHLRGATDFRWNNLAGEIMVSAYDLERNEQFKQEAEHWRAERKHNVFRVRIKRKA